MIAYKKQTKTGRQAGRHGDLCRMHADTAEAKLFFFALIY